ncbi:hypothetical protein BD311DRAFT_765493 [Dichomitus squalens]|uniref:Uncharacterized protein n=1 Tax=Dichomitus squalens TaxID=114155 RepID=A0A4Q9MES9_9APHY|nr:hypothetical protein BD311DRAFT_765493 [Dichomitus squalens]
MRRVALHKRELLPSISTLAVLKTSLEVLGKFGSTAPFLQATVDTALQIIHYAEEVKRNRHDSLELALSTAKIVEALLKATRDVSEHEMDERFKEDIHNFHERLLDIITTMEHLTDTTVWKRVLQKDSHSQAIARHRQALHQALVTFQIVDGISMRILAIRHHDEVMGSLRSLTTLLSQPHLSANMSTAAAPVSTLPTSRPASPPSNNAARTISGGWGAGVLRLQLPGQKSVCLFFLKHTFPKR